MLANEIKITKGERHTDKKSYKKANSDDPDEKKLLFAEHPSQIKHSLKMYSQNKLAWY